MTTSHFPFPWEGEKTERRGEDSRVETETVWYVKQKLWAQAKQRRNSFTASHQPGRCSATSQKAGPQHTWGLLRKANARTTNITPFLLLPQSFHSWPRCQAAWGIPQVSQGQLFRLYLLGRRGAEGEKRQPWCCTGAAQQQLKHQCVTNTVLVTNPKHSSLQATLGKVNSTPASTPTINSYWQTGIKFAQHQLFRLPSIGKMTVRQQFSK